MDLHYIAAQLLATQPVQRPVVHQQQPQSPPTPALENVTSAPTTKISMSDYLKRKQELENMINGDAQPSSEENIEPEASSRISSSDSESESESEAEVVQEPGEMDEDDDDKNTIVRTRHEVTELPPVPPPAVIKIPDEHDIIPIGHVHGIMDDTVIVMSYRLEGDNQALDAGSILAFGDRHVLGEIYDTFGPVHQPLYSVRFNSADEIDKERTIKSAIIYRSPQFSKIVFTAMLKAMKGSDASNLYDEEIPESDQEFSDDEQEAASKAKKRNGNRKVPRATPPTPPQSMRPPPRPQQYAQPTQYRPRPYQQYNAPMQPMMPMQNMAPMMQYPPMPMQPMPNMQPMMYQGYYQQQPQYSMMQMNPEVLRQQLAQYQQMMQQNPMYRPNNNQ